MKKNNFKKVVISLCLLLTVFGCSSKAFAGETLMNYRETEVRDGFTQGVFELNSRRAVIIINRIEGWTTSERSRQNMQVEVWKRIGVGQYSLVDAKFTSSTGEVEYGSFYEGGTGSLTRYVNLEPGIYKLKFVSADSNVCATVSGIVGLP
ncbi:hypothetical protein GCM10008908_35060 [Clostridium subterminale]|uniref:DUF5626 domain-containing protein n=1 Tax=Clostridium subterminale TaxID=1550 RepID=A0ABP3W6D5_CLOSU